MLSTRRQQHRVWGCSGSCSCEAATLSCHYLHVTSEQADDAGQVFADIDPASFLPRAGQVQWDHYYMEVALTIRKRANCLHAKVGAVLVLENRIISTGFNGTPAGFPNCEKGGCERCKQQYYADIGDVARVTDPEFLDPNGPKHLDLCICVHAEANALLSAAKFGNRTDQATLYTTHKPCFSCLKEAMQAGIRRVVWLKDYTPSKSLSLQRQYKWMEEHLCNNDKRNFEQLEPQSKLIAEADVQPRKPVLDEQIGPADDIPQPPSDTGRTARTDAPAQREQSSAPPSG